MDESLLDKFETAQYEDQIGMYLTALEKGQLDEDTAFEMLNTLFEQTAVHRQRARFDELANTLRSHAPDLYKAEAGYVLEWQITHALVDGRFDPTSCPHPRTGPMRRRLSLPSSSLRAKSWHTTAS